MRLVALAPILVAASVAACSELPTEPEQPRDGRPSLAVAQAACPNSVTYFFTEVQWNDVSTGFVFGHLGPRHSKVSGVQEYVLTIDAPIRSSLQASAQGGCSADVHILAQGYADASGNSMSQYQGDVALGVNATAGKKRIIARILDELQLPPLPSDCSTYPSSDACVYDYDHAIALFPLLNHAPTVGDQLRIKGDIKAEARVKGKTQYDESGASYMIYRNGPSMPKLVISLP